MCKIANGGRCPACSLQLITVHHNKKMNKKLLRILAFLPLLMQYVTAHDHLLPVDGRIGGWNSIWQHLNSKIPSPGYDMAAILVEPSNGESWMAALKGTRDDQYEVWLSRFVLPPDRKAPLSDSKVIVCSRAISYKLAKDINQHFVNLLLNTRFPKDVGKAAFWKSFSHMVTVVSIDGKKPLLPPFGLFEIEKKYLYD